MAQRRSVQSGFLLQYEVFGKPISLHDSAYNRDANPRAHQVARWWYRAMETLLENKMIRPHTIKVMDGSWESIVKGLARLQRGEVSGEKLVVQLC